MTFRPNDPIARCARRHEREAFYMGVAIGVLIAAAAAILIAYFS